jgi:hypothetical protein
MGGLTFEVTPPVQASAPERMDIACFMGFVARRPAASPTISAPYTPVPDPILAWLAAQGYSPAGSQDPLLDLPVPIESFSVFDGLFAWESRAAVGSTVLGTYLGAALRSFFVQGGRKCYVVRAGDPWGPGAPSATRLSKLVALGVGATSPSPDAGDRSTWHGVGHLFALPDVSFLVMPDLADIVAPDPPPPPPPLTFPPAPEVFVVCSPPGPAAPADGSGTLVGAPRCDGAGYVAWAAVLERLVALVRQTPLREVQIVAAVPMPLPGAVASLGTRVLAAGGDLYGFLLGRVGSAQPLLRAGTESAFLQLVYPWVKTPGSAALPEGLESPDAVLAGVLARGALLRGTFRTVAGEPLGDVFDVLPVQARADLSWPAPDGTVVSDRVSILGRTPSGLAVISDVTTHPDAYRSAGHNRLMSTIVRAAQQIGATVAFEPSSPRTWRSVVRKMTRVLDRLTAAGAFTGTPPFTVRCDLTTMTQADIDDGRLVVVVAFTPSSAIDEIVVALTLQEGGSVSVAGGAPS